MSTFRKGRPVPGGRHETGWRLGGENAKHAGFRRYTRDQSGRITGWAVGRGSGPGSEYFDR